MPQIARLDWSSWVYGLGAGFIAGGSGSVSAAFALMDTDPSYNISHPGKLLTVMAWTFLLPGLVAGFAYLKQNPLPAEIKTVTVETTRVQQDPPAIVKTTVETVQQTKVEEK